MHASEVIIIPAYQPPKSFPPFVRALRGMTDARILIIDDGSDERYHDRFAQAMACENTILIRKEKNGGKGAALRDGFAYARQHFSEDTMYVTADCDGQHAPEDVVRMTDALRQNPHALILGCRSFDEDGVPFRSRLGNKVSALLFKMFFGHELKDTQTGLRAFSHELLPMLLDVRGNGFDYETRVLTACAPLHVPILCVDIETRYAERLPSDAPVSHFSPLKDSVRILHVLLSSSLRYALVAVLCSVLDSGVFFLLQNFVFGKNDGAVFILASVLGARVFSSLINFLLNFLFVFRQKSQYFLAKYYAVWAGRLASSYLLTLLVRPLAETVLALTLLKGLIDLLLSALTYRLLRTWVFMPE